MLQNIKGLGSSKPRANVAASYQMPRHNGMAMAGNAQMQQNVERRFGQKPSQTRIGSPLHEQLLAANLPKPYKPKALR